MSALGTWRYAYWGLTVESEIEVPEWAPFERNASATEPDVRIVVSSSEAPLGPRTGPTLEARDGAIELGIPSAGRYRVAVGRRIEVTRERDARDREVRLFLLGTAWGALCYQRGLLPLHAALVERNGEAIALCGPSGAGKSTLAAALSLLGHRILGDDLCRVGHGADGAPGVWPGAPRLKLWSDALEALQWPQTELERDHFRIDKYHVPLEASSGGFVPLRAIYVLEWGEERIVSLQGRTALRRLVADATYRPDLLAALGRTEEHWRLCLDLVRQVPVRLLSRPRDLGLGERVARRLSEHEGSPS